MHQSHIDKAVYDLSSSVQDVTKEFKGGAAAIARELGKENPKYFNNQISPDYSGAILNIRDLIGIMLTLGEEQRHHLLIAFNKIFDHASMPIGTLSDISDEALLDSWAQWDAERGQTAEKIREALSSRNHRSLKRISPNEYREIKKEMIEDIQKELELLRRLEAS